MKAELGFLNAFPHGWSVELPNGPLLIASARQYTFIRCGLLGRRMRLGGGLCC